MSCPLPLADVEPEVVSEESLPEPAPAPVEPEVLPVVVDAPVAVRELAAGCCAAWPEATDAAAPVPPAAAWVEAPARWIDELLDPPRPPPRCGAGAGAATTSVDRAPSKAIDSMNFIIELVALLVQ